MATFDLTSKATAGVGANKLAMPSTRHQGEYARMYEAYLDIAKMIKDGHTIANGDVFQLLYIPAPSLVLFAGAEVITAFDGTAPTVDIDFDGGDDIIDGGDVTVTGFLAGGTNGQTNVVTKTDATYVAGTYTQLLSAADTLDVTLTAASSDVTEGLLRVYACVAKLEAYGNIVPVLAPRDQLA